MALSKVDAIAIGGFDGMHMGHQRLFEALGENGAIVVIETGYANLTPGSEREHYTHYPIVYYSLDDIRHLEGKEFIDLLKKRFPLLKKIVVGYDFHFGKNRRYSHSDLGEFFDGEVSVIDQVSIDGDSVHSHKIRAKIQIGDIAGANRFLGHNYRIKGSVVKGQGIGKRDLVATINLECKGYLLPYEGVYAALTRIKGEEHLHPSVVFVGHRVTTDGSYAIESHILGEEIGACSAASVCFVKFIRKNQKFESLDALKEAIQNDIALAKTELNRLSL
ncbi:MAG: bifunctional riboflavin kinase/FAD synthetase [Sulfuricurvum sp.]|uniref:bifunctional riboflavin kinase/FAD synthetase n=1 Tax=Sulfuricurvum sp. TaxID=2025608 RepID=UPI0026276720|nr:bifunctional riboflavin kinase/FAD synthetase [Sulfuricurvum sp.]MDD2837460.1 bifunctional riboflavin kinase/FAD synthetase [Sulfuricurvum sp.]MDD3596846.1 bifunctional riboflavin kinase/FAD synthetase [Sulfuricurvum sp.]MDD4883271.1 bifunctional riboflavin kinase/FAD synthetase [Sulfuricurvum sp.]